METTFETKGETPSDKIVELLKRVTRSYNDIAYAEFPGPNKEQDWTTYGKATAEVEEVDAEIKSLYDALTEAERETLQAMVQEEITRGEIDKTGLDQVLDRVRGKEESERRFKRQEM